MKWSIAIKMYQDYLRIERGLSTNTIANYSLDVQKVMIWLDRKQLDISPLKISEETIQQFIYDAAKSAANTSQARLISGLKGFFNYLVFEEYRKTNPLTLIEAPKMGRKLPDTLSEGEINQIINQIDLSSPQGERNKAILETLYGCGLRVSELISIKISDLFFEEGFIKVTGKGNKQRFVPVGNHTIKHINLYRNQVRVHHVVKEEAKDTLFLNRRGNALTRAMIFTIIKRLVSKAGILKNVSPHTFRHSFATHLLSNGADLRAIQQMLGHESITTTEIYTHIDTTHLAKMIHQFHPRRTD